MSTRDLAAFVLLAAVWGGSFIFIRVAAPAFGPLALMAARVLIAGLLLWAVMAVLRRPLRLRAHLRGLLVLGAVNAALPFTLIAWAELHLTASFAALLNATVPLFTALVSAVWLRERLSGRRAVGLVLGMGGVAVLVGWSPVPPTPVVLLGIAAMLGATLCYGFGAVYTKQRMASASAPTLAVGQQLAAGALLLLPALTQAPGTPPPAHAVWALVGLALLSTTLAFLLFFHLIARIGPTRTNSVTFLIPVFGMTWGALFLGEPITRGMLGGFALILFALVLVNDPTPERRRPRREPSTA